MVDWVRGKEHRQWRIQQLISMGCPEVIFAGERRLVDKTVYVGIEFPGWPGNPVYSHFSDLTAEDCLSFEAETYDLALLKFAGHALAEALACHLTLGGGGSTMPMRVIAGKHDLQRYVREYFQPPFQVPLLRELLDWKESLHRGIVLFLSQFKQRNLIDELIHEFASYDAFASSLLDEIQAVSPVQKCFSLDDDMPFSNGVLLDHGHWLTHIRLSGVPREILT